VEYKPVVSKFSNLGIVQRKDPADLPDGAYIALQNATSIQEGSLSSRFGSTRFSGLISGSDPHSLGLLRLSPADSDQYFYVGSGSSVYRINKGSPGSSTTMGNASLDGQRWTSLTYKAGQSGKAWFYLAASQMRKDDLESSTFENWGIIPPPGSPTTTVGSQYSLDVQSTPQSHTWGGTGFETLSIKTSSSDLSAFDTPSAAPSGSAASHYDSQDYLALDMTLSDYTKFDYLLLQLDVGDGSFSADYYEKTILPFGTDVSTVTPTVYGTPAFMPQPATTAPASVVVNITKASFLKIGAAGTGSTDWKTVAKIRLLARSTNTGESITVNSLTMLGGQGPDNQSNGGLPYDYLYVYRNDNTTAESNPCPTMIQDNWLTGVHRTAVAVNDIVYSTDTQVTSIAVFRRGGVYADGLYRLLGYVSNSSGGGTTTFTDAYLDSDIINSRTLEFDNDPPVLSTLPNALVATFTGANATGSHTVTLSTSVSGILTPGSTVHIIDADKSEDCHVVSVSGSSLTTYFQQKHSGTITLRCEAVCGLPCSLSAVVGDSMYLAGDANNPHVLYKSKTGRPESWPVITEATGNANQIIVGSQSNPIMALAEYGGDVACLNLHGIFTVRVFQGRMLAPVGSPATHGLVTSTGWCPADGGLAYLSNDGVYIWYGGLEQKLSEQIDWVFKSQTIGGLVPLDMSGTGLAKVRFAYFRNEIWITGVDTNGAALALIYNTIYKRWEIRTPSAESTAGTTWGALKSTAEGFFTTRVVGSSPYLYQELTGTSDNSGLFPCVIQTGWFDFGNPRVVKQFGDISVELTSGLDVTVKTYFDYASSPDETLTVTGASGRRIIPIVLDTGNAREAKTVSFRFEFTPDSSHQIALHSLTFDYFELAEAQRGKPTDWKDGGYVWDKRLDQLYLDYDTGGNTVALNLDIIGGVPGNTVTLAKSTFSITGNSRSQVSLPIKAASGGGMVIAKKYRLRPTSSATDFRLHNWDVTFQQYPPDITYFTDPNDYGNPYDKNWNQLVLDVDTGGVAATIDIYLDGANVANQSISLNTNSGTRQQTLTLDHGLVGKKARMVFTPGNNGKFQLFSHHFVTTPADKGEVVHTIDWTDLGHPYDKRLYQVFLEYEVATDIPMIVEGISGIGSSQAASTIATITLKASTRRRDQFALPNNTIAKLVRIRPDAPVSPATVNPTTSAKIYKCDFQKEDYPADVVAYTPTSDCGSPYDKYFDQLVLDVDTGGIAASVQVEIDGTVQQTVSVTSTQATRAKNFTLSPALMGKRARILNTPGTNGKFQLFSANFITTPADKGPVRHSFDWDDLGHPFDKRLKTVTFMYDNMSGGDTVMYVDTLTGINGTTITQGAMFFTLNGATRGEQTFAVPDGTIVKAVRIYPFADNITFKHWEYKFDFEKFPADTLNATDWDNLGYPCEKILRDLTIDIDTGGVACTVELQADGVTKQSYSITTTTNDRVRMLSCASDIADTYIIGKQFRLKFTPGNGGKAQYFAHSFERTQEPCAATHWDSFEQTFGSVGYRYIRQIWCEYRGGAVTLSLYTDTGGLIYQKQLPAHTQRTTERFYLPPKTASVLNKAKGHRIVMDAVNSAAPFYLYRDSSRCEVMHLSANARAGLQQSYLWSDLPLAK
jgi:hypothetical protein